jgi:hypothetical protein
MTLTHPTEYDPLAFGDFSSPPAFELPSPISDYSSLGEEDLFDQKPLINPWVLNNNITSPTVSWSTPSRENPPAMKTPDLGSSSESSASGSPRDVETKKPTKRTRKHPSEAKSANHRTHNLIEKRYRNNLNSKIMSLRNITQSLNSTNSNKDGDDAMDGDAGESKKASKVRAFSKPNF